MRLRPIGMHFPDLRNELFEKINEASMRLNADDVADAIRACVSVRSFYR